MNTSYNHCTPKIPSYNSLIHIHTLDERTTVTSWRNICNCTTVQEATISSWDILYVSTGRPLPVEEIFVQMEIMDTSNISTAYIHAKLTININQANMCNILIHSHTCTSTGVFNFQHQTSLHERVCVTDVLHGQALAINYCSLTYTLCYLACTI